MKGYFNVILFASIALLLFPFLGFPELWENIYVSVLAFVIGYTSMLLRHKTILKLELDKETSLNDYVQELKDRFRNQDEEGRGQSQKTQKKISDIQLDE